MVVCGPFEKTPRAKLPAEVFHPRTVLASPLAHHVLGRGANLCCVSFLAIEDAFLFSRGSSHLTAGDDPSVIPTPPALSTVVGAARAVLSLCWRWSPRPEDVRS